MTLTITIDNLPEDIARMIAHDLEAKAKEMMNMHGVNEAVKTNLK